MPKVTCQVARKDYPGIKKGERYYKWSFFRSRTPQRSLTPPRPSQLTQSLWSAIYAAQESIQDAESPEDLSGALDDAEAALESAQGQYEEAAEAMGDIECMASERALHLEELMGAVQEVKETLQEALDTEGDLTEEDDDDEPNPDAWTDLQSEALALDWDPPN